MKKLSLESFQSDAIKSEISRSIMGGSGEGTQSSTAQCTQKSSTWMGDVEGDTTYDGDYYTSC
jgi:hypothetical protein